MEDEDQQSRTQLRSLPSDYSDVQPKSYDPDFITHISSKMQVPYSIGIEGVPDLPKPTEREHATITNMRVPDRIMVAGDGKHIGARDGLQQLDFEKMNTHSQYVGLQTPPRTLTMEEAFPTLEVPIKEEQEHDVSQHQHNKVVPNGGLQPKLQVPYHPSESMNESLLMNDMDENTKIRATVAKLTRRVKDLEDKDQSNTRLLYFMAITFSLKMIYDFMKRK